MSKPTGVKVSALLMMLSLAAGLVISYVHGDTSVIFWVVIIALSVITYFYWTAHNWARMLVLIYSFLCVIPVRLVHHQWVLVRFSWIAAGQALLAIYLLWYLNTRPIRDWFGRSPHASDTPKQSALRATTHFSFKSPFKRN
jgi:hypothetical protein